jgi:hypothetical protein
LTLDNDFAIVELKGPINFSDFPNIRPICLPVPGHELPLGSEVSQSSLKSIVADLPFHDW